MAVNPYLAVHALGECKEAVQKSLQEIVGLRASVQKLSQLIGFEFEYQVKTLRTARLTQPLFEGFRNLWVRLAMQFHEVERQVAHLYYLPALKLESRVDLGEFAFDWKSERARNVASVAAIEDLLKLVQNEFKSVERSMDVFFDRTKVRLDTVSGRNVWSGPEEEVLDLVEKSGSRLLRRLGELHEGLNGVHGRFVTQHKALERGEAKAEAAKDKVSVG